MEYTTEESIMGACKVEVDPGVCKMKTVIIAEPGDDMVSVVFKITSDCPYVQKLAAAIEPVDPYSTIDMPINESPVYICAGKCLPHAACPVPCAIVKAEEVASDLGLIRDVKITISNAE